MYVHNAQNYQSCPVAIDSMYIHTIPEDSNPLAELGVKLAVTPK